MTKTLQLITLAFVLLLSACSSLPDSGKNGSNQLVAPAGDTIPFRLTDANNMSIRALLNDRDTVDLMFHTAAGSITLTKTATARLTSVDFTERDTVSSWGGSNESRSSRENKLRIGKSAWTKLPIWENDNSGPETDGKFGPHLFADQVILFDFDRQHLIVYDSLPVIDPAYQRAEADFEDDFIFLSGQLQLGDTALSNRFLLHSGYGGTLLLDDVFVQEHELSTALEIISTSILKDSYGNELKTQKAILPGFQMGALKFSELPVGFFEGAIGRQKMSVLGGGLLKRFNIILDLRQKAVYLKPNSLTDRAFPVE
ncbi:hypothetical protein [Flavilitoribacter nigricans]|uniref:Clan AA aspartic protease n=1 Tax=Flavilitoribacter nigricans (strain ATCC 23147 / DSM 23189 / NBRC 102662 / NCIMB 1420 / SS-2) TaxID=1122177 RepID=A0A2D0NIC4_FLAN2|nr:hypothetical protein [Flavilitoribacter nigricans]PHN08188.1 hypothetical protein CRP01_02380 [Flavilitoribacter nigricans DSM 23189 = NBRC 102662]